MSTHKPSDAVAQSEPRIYMRCDRIFGEAKTHRQRGGWIELSNFQLGCGCGIYRTRGRGGGAGSDEVPQLYFSEISASRTSDQSSPLLTAMLLSRKTHSRAIIEVVDDRQRHVLQKLILKDVVVSGMSSSASRVEDADSEEEEEKDEEGEGEGEGRVEPQRLQAQDSLSLNFSEIDFTTFSPDREPLALPTGLDLSRAVEDVMHDPNHERLWLTLDVVNLILKNLKTIDIHRFGKACKLFAKSAASTDLRTIAKHSVVISLTEDKLVSETRAVVNFEGKTRRQMVDQGMYYEDEEDDFF